MREKEGTKLNALKNVLCLLALFVYGICYFIYLPPLNLTHIEGFAFLGIGFIIIMTLAFNMRHAKTWGMFLTILIVLAGVGIFLGSDIWNANTLYKQIGTVEEKSFLQDVVEIDNSQVPVVDAELASKLADKKMGEETALGSQMKVGNFTNKQQVDGKLVYVAPLEHRGFTKWFSNKEGTIGYMVVSATNLNDVKLVKELDGNPIRLKYLPSAYCLSDLKRHIRMSGFLTDAMSDFMFEIDEEGRPYWIASTYKNVTMLQNPEVTGVIVCDAQTGECKKYSIDDAPEWIDIIQPEDFIKDQLKNYGRYVNGFLNFSNKDELEVTEHMTTVFNNGDCYYYTGMSSVGKDNGTVGFILVNTRNKKPVIYKMAGATEAAAMRSAEGKVQNMEYEATTPIPLNISGIPTYFLTLKDKEGLVKLYAMVNINDYSITATGSNIMETKRAYINAMSTIGKRVDFAEEAYGYEIQGIVDRISDNVENGNTFYYLTLNDDKNIYFASYNVSEELPITRAGDRVKISYIDESNGTINIVDFDNLEFSAKLTKSQIEINEETSDLINSEDNKIIKVDSQNNEEFWEGLTQEEKSKILKQLKDKD